MSRVLVTGGAGTLGTAIVRRLLSDPAYDVRVADDRAAPLWMREGCELHSGDLRQQAQARAATKSCAHVIHLASVPGGTAAARTHPHSTLEFENALHSAVVRAALDRQVERFVYVSSALVFERAELFPTPEEHLLQCPAPRSAPGYARLSGERHCEAAAREHGLQYTICRPFDPYGPPAGDWAESELASFLAELIDDALGDRPPDVSPPEQRTSTPTHVDDIAAGILAALGSPAAVNEDFNLGAERELTLDELARIALAACHGDRPARSSETPAVHDAGARRSFPSVEKARELLSWQAQIELEAGIGSTVGALRERQAATATATATATAITGRA